MSNDKKGKCIFLGTGASMGVPLIGCNCSVCTSSSPKNVRLRPSVYLEMAEKKMLIDAGPDFRQQALKENINELDAVFFTHTHYDHIAGIDELRIYYIRTKQPLNAIVSKETMQNILQRYPYLFKEKNQGSSLTAQLKYTVLENPQGEASFEEIPFSYMSYFQAGMKVTGYRFGSFAYLSDIKNYTDDIFIYLQNLEHLVISALRKESSVIHFNLEEALLFADRVKAKYCWITHVSHELDHEKTNAILPKNIQLAYDGQMLYFSL